MADNSKFYPTKGRVILHIDMNAFYCSVHEAEEPEKYKGKPSAVSGSVEKRKGIIVTCSYPARKRGVKTGMHVIEALKICPDLMMISPDFQIYKKYSQQFVAICYNYSPLVQVMSIDECFVDITGSKQFGTPLQIAETIQNRVRDELSLPCSIGVAPNKLLAKMGSDMKKPNGITVLRKRDVPHVFWDKHCAFLYGIGDKTASKLEKLGIHTLGQLAHSDLDFLTKHFGVVGKALLDAANGLDDSPVVEERQSNKSIGHATTLPVNFSDIGDIKRVFLNLADQVSRRLRKQQLLCSTVQITIRDPDMKTITRSTTLNTPTEDRKNIFETAMDLFEKHWPEHKPVRLLGLTLQKLAEKKSTPIQLDLFDYDEQDGEEVLTETMDKLRDKFGENAIITAGMLGDDPSVMLRDKKRRGTSLQKDDLSIEHWEASNRDDVKE
ncbi:DNA polymerase IV [Longirhabdus pacifica]|uniref:DNA polymerase IV n=1 Tax=Longirhabdus pacifica TaxID=2305227 RepID=UPI0023EA4F30|nr:DNA polymerase IV [Longirhabdus pacifica]